jgi:peptide/nickel transport system substrate-binding protein
MIIPRHVFEPYNGANAKDAPPNLKPVGTGPFRVVEFKNEDILIIGGDAVTTIKIVYERNPLFRDADKVFFSRVELQGGGGDALVAARATKDGLTDYAWNLVLGGDLLDQMEATGKARAIISFGSFTERIMLNFTDPNRETADGERSSTQFPHPFLTDPRVRQAIALAVDKGAIAQLWGRGGRATNNLLVSPPSYASPNTTAEFNLQKAAALLDQAGWRDTNGDKIRDKDGEKLSLSYQTSINPARQQTQEIVKRALESIGFEVELQKIDSSIFLGPVGDNTNTRRHFYTDLEQYAFSNKSPDPGAYMAAWTCAEIAQKANQWSRGNWGRYCNPEYDALYQKSTTEMDPARRQQLFIQMNDLLVKDVALIPLVHQAEVSGVSLSLEGLDITPWDVEVWNIKDWRRK